jgi:hypothetical protein
VNSPNTAPPTPRYANYVLGVLLTCSLGAVLFALAGRTIEKDMEAGRQTALAV